MSIKTSFSIKDLENLSGIKAGTIRIWEKRYGLLTPERSESNIRTYDLDNLQKLLNIVLLSENGFKISKIAQLKNEEIFRAVRELVIENKVNSHAINAFKLSMLNFDLTLFENTFNQLLTQKSFREIFLEIILDLLDQIGILWSSNTITPAHEHFISTLIQQKLLVNIERVYNIQNSENKTVVLFLPLNEIHELGLLYIHFELLLKGYRSIYLGSSVPIENLHALQSLFSDITYVSYFTIQPHKEDVIKYLNEIDAKILKPKNEHLHIIGRNTKEIDKSTINKGIHVHSNIISLVENI